MRLQFLGANRQVTGSRYLLDAAGLRILIDCGMFQERQFRDRNWQTSPVPPDSIDVLLLTHAHLDHVGLVPRLVANGFSGRIVTTKPSVDLAEIVMADSARIQEEDVKYKKKRHKKEKRKSPHPYVPLYTVDDAERAAGMLDGVDYNKPIKLNDAVSVTWFEAGHILGSACVELRVTENGSTKTVLFSGDIGQADKPFIGDPSLFEHADYIVMESTYGDRSHCDRGPIETQLIEVITDTFERGGNLVVPTFAIERAQELIYHFGRLMNEGFVPQIPVYLDSPMAAKVTNVFKKYRSWMDEQTKAMIADGDAPLDFDGLTMTRSRDESKALNEKRGPNIILAGSGMCTGGRIKHHLRKNIDREESTILFVGFQSVGTLGRVILDGKDPVRIHGRPYAVNARLAQICGFSAHADRDDLLNWAAHFKSPPKRLFLTHGEEDAANALAETIRKRQQWDVAVPAYQDVVELD